MQGRRGRRLAACVMLAGGGVGACAVFVVRDGTVHGPTWSPDGRRIAFVHRVYLDQVEARWTVWTMAADGSGAEPLVELPGVASVDWHPDGTSLLVDSDAEAQQTFLVDARTGRAEALGPGAEHASWSPDGRRVYYFRSPDGPRASFAWSDWHLAQGHVEDGTLVDDRTVLDDDLRAGSALAVGPCG